MERWGFCGPTSALAAVNVDAERSINLMPVVADSGTPKVKLYQVHTPGLRWWQSVGNGPIRALFEQAGRAWVISGGAVAEVFAHRAAVTRGVVRDDGWPASVCSNGIELLILSGGLGYLYDLTADTVTKIASVDFPANAVQGIFMDGYFLVLTTDNTFYLSGLDDGSSWDPLDVNQRSQVSDPWVAVLRNHREVWLLGQQTTNVYTDTGDVDTPFAPVPGILVEQGIIARWTLQGLDNTFCWLGANALGSGVVYRSNGYTPERISTHAVEYKLQQSAVLPRASAFTYQHEGHLFYQLHVPDLETSMVYDVATKLWHERAQWDPVQLRWFPHRATTHMQAFGRHIVGDRETAGLYDYRLDQYEDQIVEAA